MSDQDTERGWEYDMLVDLCVNAAGVCGYSDQDYIQEIYAQYPNPNDWEFLDWDSIRMEIERRHQ